MKKNRRVIIDILMTLGILAACTVVAMLLAKVDDDNNPFAAILYVLGVTLIARYTSGYAYGIVASALSVACVNYFFTIPFHKFNITLAGYPMTFTVMLIVSVIISAMSTRLKNQERVKSEAENEKMRANLLRSISHDIRTPIASILGASSAILESKNLTDGERDEMLQEIQKDARWLARVTENILSITKLNVEGVKLKTSEEVVEEIVGSAIVKFRKHKDALLVDVHSPDDILLVPMDATLIEQLLINLFENVEAHGKGATKIWLDIENEENKVVFKVSDDGAGFPSDKLPKIFEGSVSSSTQTNSDGHRNMGIGLSVCRTIVVSHGGGMKAYNNDRGGATVEFYLPY